MVLRFLSKILLISLLSVFFAPKLFPQKTSPSTNHDFNTGNKTEKYPTQLAKIIHKTPIHIMCISIPKCGTHLLYRCLCELKLPKFKHPEKEGQSEEVILKARAMNQNPPPNHYRGLFHIETVGPIPPKLTEKFENRTVPKSFWSHWPYTVESEELFNKYCYASFFCIRDPRSMVVSMVHMVYKSRDGREVDFTTALKDLIDGGQRQYIEWAVEHQSAHPLMWEYGLVKFYELYLAWMESEKFLTIRFEDLVGKEGGGIHEKQVQEIKKIAKHCRKKLTTAEAENISKKIYGNSLTFRQGKIDSWKETFTPEILEIFKNTPGANELLIKLGYEKNEDWMNEL